MDRPWRRLAARAWLGVLALWIWSAAGCATLQQPLETASLATPKNLAKTVAPSNAREWAPDQTLLPHADIQGDRVRVSNIRNCHYLTADTYVLRYEDRTYRLDDVQTVDFLVMPFDNLPVIAHTMLSFGLADGSYLGASVEIRREQGESYGPLRGFFRQYELMYVLGDERDLVKLCTNHLASDVYLYRTRATPEQARAMFLDVLTRANKLYAEPEFYHTLTNNCTTNIARHVNQLAPGKVPLSVGLLLPGLSDRLAYDLGLLDTSLPFDEARREAYITEIAQQHADAPDFSQRIRQR